MKATGMLRRVDRLGRVIIPKILRKTNHIHSDDLVEILVEDNKIVIRKYKPICTFCGMATQVESMIQYKDKQYCEICAEELQSLACVDREKSCFDNVLVIGD